MGSRNLTCVVLDGEIKVAQYGQWGAYPDGQGATIYNFLKELDANNGLSAFKTKVSALRPASEEEIQEAVNRAPATIPQFHRGGGADILAMIADGKVDRVELATSFAADSLFCEWAYVVDLDRKILEVYKGFVKEPHNQGRFAKMSLDSETEARRDPDTYYPVKEVARFRIDGLPKNLETFVDLCDPTPDEDD